MAINHLFYWNRYLNLKRYGLIGKTPLMGLGNARLERNFHYSMISLRLFCGGGSVTLLISAMLILLSHLVWLQHVNGLWYFLVMGLLVISSGLFSNLFVLQNYNILGWIFFPLGLYGLHEQNWILVAVAWFLSSVGSLTVGVLAGFLALSFSIYMRDLNYILAFLPALVKLVAQLGPFLRGGDWSQLGNLIKSLGFGATQVKYKRMQTRGLNAVRFYYLTVYSIFFFSILYLDNTIAFSVLVGMALLLINSTILRFCDEQSIYMFMILSAVFETLTHANYYLLIPFWLLISPLPIFSGFHIYRNSIDRVKVLAPVNIKKYLDAMEHFLQPVKKGERVLIAFNDPDGVYEKVFDGYRILLELVHYTAARKFIHLLPDWVAVNAVNYQGAPDFWGRDIQSVKNNLRDWKADFAIIYARDGWEETSLEEWKNSGFEIIHSFNWDIFKEDFADLTKPQLDGLKWFLIKPYNFEPEQDRDKSHNDG